MQHLVHAGVTVGVVKAGTACLLKIVPQLLLPGSNLRQPWAHDAYTNQPVAGQVNALPKYAAHHGKAKQGLAGARHKLGQKGLFLLFIHRVFLLDAVDFRAVLLELCISLLHIRITGEKRQIISAVRPHHRRQAFLHNGKACIPVLIPGADIADAEQSLIARGEGAAQGNGPCFRHAAQVLIITGRGQRCTEQHRGAPQGKTIRQKGAGVKAELRCTHLAAGCRDLQHKMIVKGIRYAQPGPHIKIQLQQCRVGFIRFSVVAESFNKRFTQAVQQVIKLLAALF